MTVYRVAGMTCGHCAQAITTELERLPGVTDVNVNVAEGTVEIMGAAEVSNSEVAAAVDEAGYQLIG